MTRNKSPDYKIGSAAGRTGQLDRYKQRLAETNSINIDYEPDELDTYGDICKSTALWHGSGRYQYDDNGNIIDVFSSLLEQGSFTPNYDEYDLSNRMDSISLTPDRRYARMYADIHHPNPSRAQRYGSPDLLTGYYIGPVPTEAIREQLKTSGLIGCVRALRRSQQSIKQNGRWSQKVNSKRPSMVHAFREGSDIGNNYPILYGFSEVEELTPISGYLAKHEVRTPKPIDLSKVTHIEVPQDKIANTQQLLLEHSLDILVLPIELGEAYSAYVLDAAISL